MADIIQFIPRPRHNRDTDFPAIPFIAPEQRALILGEPHEREVHAADTACSEMNPGDPA